MAHTGPGGPGQAGQFAEVQHTVRTLAHGIELVAIDARDTGEVRTALRALPHSGATAKEAPWDVRTRSSWQGKRDRRSPRRPSPAAEPFRKRKAGVLVYVAQVYGRDYGFQFLS